jgi:hypothetical protein
LDLERPRHVLEHHSPMIRLRELIHESKVLRHNAGHTLALLGLLVDDPTHRRTARFVCVRDQGKVDSDATSRAVVRVRAPQGKVVGILAQGGDEDQKLSLDTIENRLSKDAESAVEIRVSPGSALDLRREKLVSVDPLRRIIQVGKVGGPHFGRRKDRLRGDRVNVRHKFDALPASMLDATHAPIDPKLSDAGMVIAERQTKRTMPFRDGQANLYVTETGDGGGTVAFNFDRQSTEMKVLSEWLQGQPIDDMRKLIVRLYREVLGFDVPSGGSHEEN